MVHHFKKELAIGLSSKQKLTMGSKMYLYTVLESHNASIVSLTSNVSVGECGPLSHNDNKGAVYLIVFSWHGVFTLTSPIFLSDSNIYSD